MFFKKRDIFEKHPGTGLQRITERAISSPTTSKEDIANAHSSHNRQGTNYDTD